MIPSILLNYEYEIQTSSQYIAWSRHSKTERMETIMNTRQRIMSLLLALAMMMPFFGFLVIYADGREDDRI